MAYACQSWVWATSQAPVVSLSEKLYPHCLVLVGSRNGFMCDLHKQNVLCFAIKLKWISTNWIILWKRGCAPLKTTLVLMIFNEGAFFTVYLCWSFLVYTCSFKHEHQILYLYLVWIDIGNKQHFHDLLYMYESFICHWMYILLVYSCLTMNQVYIYS